MKLYITLPYVYNTHILSLSNFRHPYIIFAGEAFLPVGEAGHVLVGAAVALLQRHVPRRRDHVRRMVALRTHRQDRGGNTGE